MVLEGSKSAKDCVVRMGRRIFSKPCPGKDPRKASIVLRGFNPGGKAQIENDLLKAKSLVFHFAPVLIHKDHHASVISCGDMPPLYFGKGLFRIVVHVGGILVHPAIEAIKHHIKDVSFFLSPFFAVLFDMRQGCLLIEEDETGGPAVFEVKIGESREHSRIGSGRKTFYCDHLNEFLAHFGNDASPKFLPPSRASRYVGHAGNWTGCVMPVMQKLRCCRKSS